MQKLKLYLNLILSLMLIAGTLPAQALSPTTSSLIAKTYLPNGGFENGAVGYKTYKNAAQATPVTGLGGSPATTMAISTTSPIADKASALYSHGASNLQGEGVAFPFVLDTAGRGTPLSITGKYQIVSGTYSGGATGVDSDVEVYVYDVDTSTLIQPTSYKLDGGVVGIPYSINAKFQPDNINSVNFRLILHNATATTSAFQLKLDQLAIGTQNYPQGPPVTDWQSFTASGSWTTNTTYTGKYKRVGDTLQAQVFVLVSAAPNAANLTINLPPGLSIDTTKLAATYTNYLVVGLTSAGHASTAYNFQTVYNNTTSVGILYQNSTTATQSTVSATNPVSWSSDILIVNFEVPVVGWGSTTTMSDSTDQRVISFFGTQTSQAITANSTPIAFTATGDRAGGWNGTQYKVSAPGDYIVSGSVYSSVANSIAYPVLNGVATASNWSGSTGTAGVSVGSSLLMNLKAGDLITLLINQTGTVSGGSLGIYRLAGPSQIASSESVSAKYQITSGQVLSTSGTQILANTKLFDSHNAYNPATGYYACPSPGKYEVKVYIQPGTNITSTGSFLTTSLNGTSGDFSELAAMYGNGTSFPRVGGSTIVSCLGGQTIGINTIVGAANTVGTNSYISFQRVGN